MKTAYTFVNYSQPNRKKRNLKIRQHESGVYKSNIVKILFVAYGEV